MRVFQDIRIERRRLFRIFCLLQVFALLCLSVPSAVWALDKTLPTSPITATAASRPEGIAQQYTLPNGLKVVLLEDHSFPVVSCFVWYKVGARNETAGSTGLSHIVEHLL